MSEPTATRRMAAGLRARHAAPRCATRGGNRAVAVAARQPARRR
ncbi:hypothetical protein [Roseomonas fluvialis]|nr:hypothetical protein [Roseomonas fluvialis]